MSSSESIDPREPTQSRRRSRRPIIGGVSVLVSVGLCAVTPGLAHAAPMRHLRSTGGISWHTPASVHYGGGPAPVREDPEHTTFRSGWDVAATHSYARVVGG